MHGVQNWDPARFFASCQRAARGRGARYARVIFKNNIIFERSARNKNAVSALKHFTQENWYIHRYLLLTTGSHHTKPRLFVDGDFINLCGGGQANGSIFTRLPFREKPPSDTGRVYTLKVITIYLYNVFGLVEVNSFVRNSHWVQIPEHLSCGDAWNASIPPAGGPLARPVLKQHTE